MQLHEVHHFHTLLLAHERDVIPSYGKGGCKLLAVPCKFLHLKSTVAYHMQQFRLLVNSENRRTSELIKQCNPVYVKNPMQLIDLCRGA